MARRLVCDKAKRWSLHSQGQLLPQLDHGRRQRRPDRNRRLQGKGRPLSSLCQPRLPLGPP
ncbi:hypothetical protein chiPu_0033875, partial [Chiloscyllium punctatum]|nr:hypothetical protein [Chiloscyllium punctatum]